MEEETEGERLERLERELVLLRAEVASLRAQVESPEVRQDAIYREIVRGSVPPRGRSARSSLPRATDVTSLPRLEELIGRHGMLALATLTVLVAMGTFLSWTIRQGLLTPTVRVVLGALTALV